MSDANDTVSVDRLARKRAAARRRLQAKIRTAADQEHVPGGVAFIIDPRDQHVSAVVFGRDPETVRFAETMAQAFLKGLQGDHAADAGNKVAQPPATSQP